MNITAKPSPALLATIKAIAPANRKNAIRLADRTAAQYFAKLQIFGDFSEAEHIELAFEAARAEVLYWYGP